ncbi:MAG: 2-aminoadipate transaminase [Herbaspirillum frisingense]|uniref:2-aminoadipate transaminase n=1 Tax=Herbaspirillum frisingense TaxID=92645 RepID=A0A7V8FZY7_9BURK|nr:MAG: 2-aminoadipate transaminase [Herbaspirillum frisingense]
MALIRISGSSGLSLVEQVVGQMKQLIDNGVVRDGSRAASIRVFARDHRISAHTVAEAYERLVAQGYFQSRPRSGFFVSRPQAYTACGRDDETGIEPDHLWQLRSHFTSLHDRLGASNGRMPADWLDIDLIRSGMKSLAAKADTSLAQYGDPFGYAPLRGLLQTRLLGLGIHAQPEQILLTNGATQAADLLMRCFLKRGDRVLVDDPGYFNLFSNLHLHGIRPVPVPRRADGPDLDLLDALVREHQPSMMFVQSMLHAPTGSSIAPAKAHRLLKLAEQHDFRIVENDVYCDMLGLSLPRLATLDQLARVFYVGSFSKTLSSATRVGFVAGAADAIGELSNRKMVASITGSQVDERLVYHALTEGQYRRSVERLRYRLANAQQQACDMLEAEGFELFCRPLGGKFVWARHPEIDDSEEIWKRAARAGILIAPGKVFRDNLQATPWFRLNVAYCMEPALLAFLSGLRA